VFQNLVQNAAEAARHADGNPGHLSVSCVVERGESGVEMLTLRFADDGVGICDEDLARIFENGFSTKSRDTNQGIGLHWCANAINAIGGRIRAERAASGGAILYVTVPLQRSTATAKAA
jgi:two-component system NtrC family sensor kinase